MHFWYRSPITRQIRRLADSEENKRVRIIIALTDTSTNFFLTTRQQLWKLVLSHLFTVHFHCANIWVVDSRWDKALGSPSVTGWMKQVYWPSGSCLSFLLSLSLSLSYATSTAWWMGSCRSWHATKIKRSQRHDDGRRRNEVRKSWHKRGGKQKGALAEWQQGRESAFSFFTVNFFWYSVVSENRFTIFFQLLF